MRINLIPLFASAALVSAVPLRVIVVSSNGNIVDANNAHAGHAANEGSSVAGFVKPNQELQDKLPGVAWFGAPLRVLTEGAESTDKKPHHGHMGGRPCAKNKNKKGKGKLVDISNSFRGAFGLPLIEMGENIEGNIHGGLIHITGTKFIGNPDDMPKGHHGGPHHHHHMGKPFHHREGAFLQRIHAALMSLGPWEGRAVAFVLGCGIGVLLRMFFVLAIVAVRAIKGRKEEEDTTEYAIIYEYHEDAEEIAVPPPNYHYPVDEKVEAAPVVDESK